MKKQLKQKPHRERTGKNINVWLPSNLVAAFEELRTKTRLTRTNQVAVILEEHLQKLKLWPPAD